MYGVRIRLKTMISWGGHEKVIKAFMEQLKSGISIAPEVSCAAMAIRVIEAVLDSSSRTACK